MQSALTLATIHADLTLVNVSAAALGRSTTKTIRDALLYAAGRPERPEDLQETKLWVLGSYSRFIHPGAVRIGVDTNYLQPHAVPIGRPAVPPTWTRPPGTGSRMCGVNPGESEASGAAQGATSLSVLNFSPFRTSPTKEQAELDKVELMRTENGGAVAGTVVLAPLSVTTFIADYAP